MPDDAKDQDRNEDSPIDRSRRDFVTLSVAAGLAAATGSASAADLPVVEANVDIKTPDGTCDAAFIHPTTGSHPGVLHLARRVRPAPGDARHRQAHRRRRLLGAGAESVLSRGQGAGDCRPRHVQLPESSRYGEAAAADGVDQRAGRRGEGRRRVHRVPRRAAAGQQGEEDRHAGLLHGRAAGGQDRGGAAQSRRRRRVVPRRRPGDRRSPTARTCSRRRSRRACISASRRTTTCASRTRRTS